MIENTATPRLNIFQKGESLIANAREDIEKHATSHNAYIEGIAPTITIAPESLRGSMLSFGTDLLGRPSITFNLIEVPIEDPKTVVDHLLQEMKKVEAILIERYPMTHQMPVLAKLVETDDQVLDELQELAERDWENIAVDDYDSESIDSLSLKFEIFPVAQERLKLRTGIRDRNSLVPRVEIEILPNTEPRYDVDLFLRSAGESVFMSRFVTGPEQVKSAVQELLREVASKALIIN